MKSQRLIVALLVWCAPLAARAQTSTGGTEGVPLHLDSSSTLTFTGTSTMHAFKCTTHALQAFIDVDSSYATANLTALAHPIIGVRIVIPVKSLACGGELEGNMLKTLRAKEYPTITYVLKSYDSIPGTVSASAFSVETKGELTISGQAKEIAMRVDAARISDSLVIATGEEAIQMTDFGIKPPTFMLGVLRVGNKLVVQFRLKATAKAVTEARAALAAQASPATMTP